MVLHQSCALVDWVWTAEETRGIRFAQSGEAWELWSYARLARRAREVAAALRRRGVTDHDVVAIVARSTPAFVTGFFGTLVAGATPAPLTPPTLFDDDTAYQDMTASLLRGARPACVLVESDLHDALARCARSAGVSRLLAIDNLTAAESDDDERSRRAPPRTGLLQFTSGSSALKRGVYVSASAIDANVQAIRRWLRWTPDDAFASWLPLHHDMGLIGALVCSVVGQSDLWLLQPEHFIRHPLRYLQCFGRQGATLSVMPNFGLDYIARRVRPAALSGCEFSTWRGLVIGAERVDAASLDRFTGLLGPFGFDARTLLPAYGLAEATLAVTGVALDARWTSVDVDPASLSFDREIVVATPDTPHETVVGCGRPLGDAAIEIIDGDGHPVSSGRVGEIVVRSSSLASGYVDDRELASTRIEDGRLITGDAGFLYEGELFVLGRLGDSLKIRGRVVFGEQIEIAISAVGIPRERVAALLGLHAGAPTVVVIVERAPFDVDQLCAVIRLHADEARPVIVSAPAGAITRTTSGKPQRRRLWQAFVDGTLPGPPIEPASPSSVTT